MNTHLRRFLLIGITTLVGLWASYPPGEKLKFGIDLSGGTILVYEVKPGTRPDFNMDELIGALKRRVNPEGVQDIPIRKVGSNRIELILPEGRRRRGGRDQEADDRRRLARIPHPGQREARTRSPSIAPDGRSTA